jgi:aminopeptidase
MNPMASEFEQNLERYVEVILKVGLNLQKGQRLIITELDFTSSTLELAPFIEIIARKAYQIGARYVEVMWNNPKIHLIRFQHAPRDSFEEYPIWRTNTIYEYLKNGDAFLGIMASDPNLFIDQDPTLMDVRRRTALKHSKGISELSSKLATNLLIISVPTDDWAEKIFPDLQPEKAKAKLWDAIFDICRVKKKDPISSWNDHIDNILARRKYLNNKKYSSLKLRAPGTDLTVGLPEKNKWLGGREKSQNGIEFTANIPTEEICTAPHKDMSEGTVTSTKTLYFNGVLIEDFKLTFKKGKVIEAIAQKGQEFLENLIKTDETSSYLGEIALVPHSSPISQSGLLFYNGLIDENASCHLALGTAYRTCIENGESMSNEEFIESGGNISLTHIDFMIGSGEMDIDGILEDGTSEPIMRKGEWAFEV